MSNVRAVPATVPPQAAVGPDDRDRSAADDRGHTHIPDRVVAEIARRAASELPDTQRGTGGLSGLVARRRARATAKQAGSQVTLWLQIALSYPVPLGSTAQHVREHVRSQVERCTGFTVRHIDITIAELVPAQRTQ